jgi:hypothetical protein
MEILLWLMTEAIKDLDIKILYIKDQRDATWQYVY